MGAYIKEGLPSIAAILPDTPTCALFEEQKCFHTTGLLLCHCSKNEGI